jgi:hypothetical protein
LIHHLVVHTQIEHPQKRNHNRRCLVLLVCISSQSPAQRSEKRSDYQCLASCSLTGGLEVENKTARGTQNTDSIHFIILDHGCATMIVPVKPIKYTRDGHFLLEDTMQEVMRILHVCYHDRDPSF